MIKPDFCYFERGLDIKRVLLIGFIRDYFNEKSIIENKHYEFKENYVIFKGDLDLSNKEITEFPRWMKTCKIGGNFWCDNNKLSSLENCPKVIHGSFSCTNNPEIKNLGRITDLGGNFWF